MSGVGLRAGRGAQGRPRSGSSASDGTYSMGQRAGATSHDLTSARKEPPRYGCFLSVKVASVPLMPLTISIV